MQSLAKRHWQELHDRDNLYNDQVQLMQLSFDKQINLMQKKLALCSFVIILNSINSHTLAFISSIAIPLTFMY